MSSVGKIIDFRHVNFQDLVKRIARKEKEAVHEFVYARGTRELLHVRWDGNQYWLESASGKMTSIISRALVHKASRSHSIPRPQLFLFDPTPSCFLDLVLIIDKLILSSSQVYKSPTLPIGVFFVDEAFLDLL